MTTFIHVPRSQPSARSHPRQAMRQHASRLLLTVACSAAIAACGDLTAPDSAPGNSPASPPVHYSDMPSVSPQQATNIQFGDFALHVPANVNHVRGILVALGGPNTQGFALGTPFGTPLPTLEASLQELGAMFRDLAAERGLAILGSSRFGPWRYPDEPASDQLLLDAIAQAASLTGRSELLGAPLLLYGISGGGPEASGFTQRNPERVTALFLKVPLTAGPLTGEALRVPAYMVLAELEAFVDNTMLTATFRAHRSAGAPWAMALEPGVPHHSLSPAQREVTVDWMRAILPLGNAGPFRQTSPQVGWLGDPATGQVAPTRTFAGDRSSASWFPTRPLAVQWAAFIGL
jgi:pimeloyl-ACP methyl ester carboxylesterase